MRAPVLAALLLGALAAAACVAAPAARANGDPASDFLLAQETFLPFDAQISKEQSKQLNGLVADAKRRGFTIRVAVIATVQDLGAVPSLWGKPETYARFLGQEIFFVYKGRLLVVMPDGYGVSRGGRALPREQRVVDALPNPEEGGAALAAAAARAVQRLAARAGVRLEVKQVTGGSGTSDRIVIAAVAGGVVLLLLAGVAARRLLARR